MNIWIINPFDQVPNETDVPLRYWALCRTFAQQGHKVIWWSSDFSHLTKSRRAPCPETDGFAVRLIETPPYTKNISFARLKNHKAFADGFYTEAMAELHRGELKAPDRIVVSLPPLGVAEQAFRIRDYVREWESEKVATYKGRRDDLEPSHLHTFTPSHLHTQPSCQVIVDIMDAWPETFYQALPKPLRKFLGPILLAPMHRSAKRAYAGADKISAVGQSYLELAQKYLGQSGSDTPVALDKAQQATGVSLLQTPTHLCYHGTDLSRFQRDRSESAQSPSDSRTAPPSHDRGHNRKKEGTRNEGQQTPHSSPRGKPLRAVYLGSMGSGYDLQTLIDVAARWKAEGVFPFQIHFAGDGPQRKALETRAAQLGLTSPQQTPLLDEEGCSKGGVVPDQLSNFNTFTPSHPASSARIVFHGHVKKDAITDLLLSAHLALVPNRPDSLVACPYKAGEYAAAGLPMISCLKGELGRLTQTVERRL
jgi:glycosyltransferase involved in cell wall biosynthesis